MKAPTTESGISQSTGFSSAATAWLTSASMAAPLLAMASRGMAASNDGDILHQQHGETGPAGVGSGDAALLDGLHGNGGRGHGQRQCHDDGDIPGHAGQRQQQSDNR